MSFVAGWSVFAVFSFPVSFHFSLITTLSPVTRHPRPSQAPDRASDIKLCPGARDIMTATRDESIIIHHRHLNSGLLRKRFTRPGRCHQAGIIDGPRPTIILPTRYTANCKYFPHNYYQVSIRLTIIAVSDEINGGPLYNVIVLVFIEMTWSHSVPALLSDSESAEVM